MHKRRASAQRESRVKREEGTENGRGVAGWVGSPRIGVGNKHAHSERELPTEGKGTTHQQ